MAYYYVNSRKLLKMISILTVEKTYTNQDEVYQNIPQKWRIDGCGTGNMETALVKLYRSGMIATADKDLEFFEGTKTKGKLFFLTEKGLNELKPWILRRWQFIFAFVVSSATIVTAVYAALDYYKKK